MKKIYIIRHGETDYNKKGMVQGSGIDSSLNETGQAQALAFYEKYKDVKFDKIYISRLVRTGESVSRFTADGKPTEVVDGLEEISWGNQEGQAFTPETSTIYQETTRRWTEGELDLKIEGGESPKEVVERQKKAMDYILRQEGETILICTHGRAMRILLTWLLKYPLWHMDNFEHTNTGLYVLNYTGELFSVETFNDTSHLNELKPA
ncbi:MAG: histidine phosphatase family protein [Cyclobacteriaceae bacterium]